MRKKSTLVTKPPLRRAYDEDGTLRVLNCECDSEFSIKGSREYPPKGKYTEKCPGCDMFPWFRQRKKKQGNNGNHDYYPVFLTEDQIDLF
jgi:hypothetical protein